MNFYTFFCIQLFNFCFGLFAGAVTGVSNMENFNALDPRKQELLEARFLGARVRIKTP